VTWLLLTLATFGVVHPEGHCLDKPALVLTQHEAEVIAGKLARGAEAERLLAGARAEIVAVKREAAQALESAALCVDAPAPACDCSEWLSGFAGAAVGAATCGGFWIGARL